MRLPLTCPNSTCTRAITVPWSIPPTGVARESSGPGGPLSYLLPVTCCFPYIQSSPYFDPTHTRTGWIGQPPILNRHEVVTIDGDVDTLGQATP